MLSLRNILVAVLSVTAFSSSVSAQDYRVNSRPREMVQPSQQQRGLFDIIFGQRASAPESYYQAPRNAKRQPEARQPEARRFAARQPLNSQSNNRNDAYVNPDSNGAVYTPDLTKNTLSSARKITRTAASTSKVGAQGTGLYCVRSCDGFFFPIANPSKVVGEKGSQQDACNTLCPGAEVEVYKSSSNSIEQAHNMTTRKAYAAHPKAFAFREKIENSCSCKGYASRGLARIPYNRDYTLRAGDVVLLDNGAHVFNGGDGFPYKNRDFASISRGSSRLSPEVRSMLVAKNVPMGTAVSRQVASNQSAILADTTTTQELEPLLAGASKSVRSIDILGKSKERPVLVIDIIQKIKQSRSL